MKRFTMRATFSLLALLGCVLAFGGVVNALAQENEPVNEIERMKAKYGTEYSIADLAPTVCEAAGLRAPKTATANKIAKVLEPMNAAFNGRKVEKIFLYCGDCIGDVLLKNHPEDFKDVLASSDAVVRSTNVMTTVTPVCFATIFCGAGPEVHGIHVYEKPVVKVETLFDVFLEAGKKIAIVSEAGNSIITIFRERDVDYYDLPKNDKEAFDKALELLRDGDYDVIVLHDCEYDTKMHQVGTEADDAVKARRTVLERWLKIVDATDEAWGDFDRLTVFVSDHGSHMPEGAKKGSHGADVYEDSVVNHFYRWRAAKSR